MCSHLRLVGRMVTVSATNRSAGNCWLAGFLLTLTACTVLIAQVLEKPSLIEDLRWAIQVELKDVSYGSVGIAPVSRDRTSWAGGIGPANLEVGPQSDIEIYWCVGSINGS